MKVSPLPALPKSLLLTPIVGLENRFRQARIALSIRSGLVAIAAFSLALMVGAKPVVLGALTLHDAAITKEAVDSTSQEAQQRAQYALSQTRGAEVNALCSSWWFSSNLRDLRLPLVANEAKRRK